jgi:Arginase family
MSDALFLEASSREILPGCPVILGCPLDETATYRAGSDKAPQAIRLGSESIETYSPLLDRDLSDHDFFDLGDLHFEPEALEKSLEIIELSVTEILKREAFPICLGGYYAAYSQGSESTSFGLHHCAFGCPHRPERSL